MWFVCRTTYESRHVTPRVQSAEPEDPVDVAKRRVFIESKLVTRKVLICSSDEPIVFSDPIKSEDACCNNLVQDSCCNVAKKDTLSDSSSHSSLCQDEEQQHSSNTLCENDDHSPPSVSSDDHVSPRDSDLKTSTHSLSTSLRHQGLVRMVSALFESEDKMRVVISVS